MLRRLTRCSSLCGEGLAPRPLHSSPWVGLPGPHPGFLSFHDERNQRRAGAAPLDPLRGARCPPCGVAAPPNRVSTTNPDRFATLRWVGESVFFSPSVSARAHLLVSGRGAAVRADWGVVLFPVNRCPTIQCNEALNFFLYYYILYNLFL